MKQISKKTVKVLTVVSLLLLTAFGLTMAYYNSQKDFKNEFHVNAPGVSIYEKFNPTDWWVPGEEKSKQAWFTNTGELDMLLRFRVDYDWAKGQKPTGDASDMQAKDVIKLYWRDSTHSSDKLIELPVATAEKPVVGVDINNFDFIGIYDPDAGTTYYYYKKILKAKGSEGSSTQKVLESVKFDTKLSNDGHQHSDYSSTQIDLTITGETVLVDPRAVKEKWPNVKISDKYIEDNKITPIEGIISWEAVSEAGGIEPNTP